MSRRLLLACCICAWTTAVRAQVVSLEPGVAGPTPTVWQGQTRSFPDLSADPGPKAPADSAPGNASPPLAVPEGVQGPNRPGRFWIDGDYLLWATSGSRLPPLITAAPATSTATVPGALGNPDTVVVVGNERVNDGLRSGFLTRAGFWLDDGQTMGLEVSFFYLTPTSRNYSAASNGTTTSLFRPILDTMTGKAGTEDISNLADGIVGQAGVQARNQFLGGDADFRQRLCGCCDCAGGYRIDLLAGYRVLYLSEQLGINENLTTLDLANNPSGTILVQDSFHTRNTFQGLQLGLDGTWWRGPWFVEAYGRVALGLTHETVDISGSTITRLPGGPAQVLSGGLLALPTNSGVYHRDPFAVAPSGGLSVGYQFTSWLRASVGYEGLYLSEVVHPANQIDPVVNPNAVPPQIGPPFNPARPAFTFHGSDFWAQGLTAGIELIF